MSRGTNFGGEPGIKFQTYREGEERGERKEKERGQKREGKRKGQEREEKRKGTGSDRSCGNFMYTRRNSPDTFILLKFLALNEYRDSQTYTSSSEKPYTSTQ